MIGPDVEQALRAKLLAMADDELILAHRNSEWTGHAPILEEDIAFTNIALDELGHARLWYHLYRDLTGTEPDHLIYFREPATFRCARVLELPRGDWAFSMLRQYLFDVFESLRAERLLESAYRPLAEVAAKVRPEEHYHIRHTQTWIQRLGQGTAESNRRCQEALEALWRGVFQLFTPLPEEDALVSAGIVPAPEQLQVAWEQTVSESLSQAGLRVPATPAVPEEGRTKHTSHLAELLVDMQAVARANAGAEW